jgi:hypothetical protein
MNKLVEILTVIQGILDTALQFVAFLLLNLKTA